MILIADNLNVLNPVVAESLVRLDPGPLQRLAKRCVAAGAALLDLNPGYLSRRQEDRMAFLVETVQEACPVRLVLDSPDPRILLKGLAVCRDKPIINGLSLEPSKLEGMLAIAVEHDLEVIALLMDERSFPPPRLDEKIALALEIWQQALNRGLPAQRLIFDPVVPNLSWPDAFSRVAEAVKTIRLLTGTEIFSQRMRSIAGLSNLRSGLRSRFGFEFEAHCLSLLAGAGLDWALVDVLNPRLIETWRLIEQMT